jgi:hypothetical protein
MKARSSFWWIGLCALTLSLSTAAIGCGDDDDTGETGGTSGGGTGGGGGKAGATAGKSGGGAGKAGSGGSAAVTPAMCKTSTTDLMKDQSGGLSAACITCICDENAKAVTDCNSNAMCWPLLSCVAEMCTDPSMQTACAQQKCGTLIAGGIPAMAAGAVIQGSKCSSKCVANESDGGMNDAGL